jgi:adenylosuccinate lyase
MDDRIQVALEAAREAERRARQLVLLGRSLGQEAAAQAWVEELSRDAARSRSAVLARLEHGDLTGALGVALSLVDAVRAREGDASGRALALTARQRRTIGAA